jgi:hypothetical protein
MEEQKENNHKRPGTLVRTWGTRLNWRMLEML